MAAINLSQLATSRRWQSNFLALVPVVETHAAIRFRRLALVDREEAVAEAVAAACLSYHQLAGQRKLHKAYASTLANFAVRRVTQDRHVGGHRNCRDVLNPATRKKRGISVTSLSPWCNTIGTWRDLDLESRRVSPADQVCFKLDLQAWLKTWPSRHCKIIAALAAGHRALMVARRFRLSEGRISQMRRAYEASWQKFQGLTSVRSAA